MGNVGVGLGVGEGGGGGAGACSWRASATACRLPTLYRLQSLLLGTCGFIDRLVGLSAHLPSLFCPPCLACRRRRKAPAFAPFEHSHTHTYTRTHTHTHAFAPPPQTSAGS